MVVSYRNSTSNHNSAASTGTTGLLYLIEILHQTTTYIRCGLILLSCILSKFYIKPQLHHTTAGYCFVVSYRNSTSNHNPKASPILGSKVVSYRNSTSNHNIWLSKATHKRLYLIEILHQTTTFPPVVPRVVLLYLIEILHQTTTFRRNECSPPGCILSKFYIKPQPTGIAEQTSPGCILSKFYIKPQRMAVEGYSQACCILSKFYIKPQHCF